MKGRLRWQVPTLSSSTNWYQVKRGTQAQSMCAQLPAPFACFICLRDCPHVKIMAINRHISDVWGRLPVQFGSQRAWHVLKGVCQAVHSCRVCRT